ncbi:MAG: hypothetical protein Q8L64_05740 [bacterium]|nr:hypothetical protein [bacterium]
MEMYKVTYIVYHHHLGMFAWQKTETNQLRPVKGEYLHMETPGLSVFVEHVERDIQTGEHFAFCKSLVAIGMPEDGDAAKSFWLVEEGWEKLQVDDRHQLAFHHQHEL